MLGHRELLQHELHRHVRDTCLKDTELRGRIDLRVPGPESIHSKVATPFKISKLVRKAADL